MTNIHPAVVAGVIAGVFVLAWLVAWAGRRLLRGSLMAREVADPETRQAVEARARQLLRGVRLLAYGMAALASVLLVLSTYNELPEVRPHDILDWYRNVLGWLRGDGLRIAVIVFGAYVTVRAINLWIQYFEYHLTSDAVGPNGQERRRRARAVDSR